MSDFKWEMQERIDAGMSPEAAYESVRESYLDAADQKRKEWKENHPEEVEYAKREEIDESELPDLPGYGRSMFGGDL